MANQIKNDPVNPNHYKAGKIEVIDIIADQLTDEELKGFCKGLITKYVFRADHKNFLEDYKKARWYLDYLIKTLEEKEKKNVNKS